MGSLFARAGPRAATPRGVDKKDPRVSANDDGGLDPVRSLVQGALRAAAEKEADTEASSFGAYGALSVEEEAREKTIFSALAQLDANGKENENENETNEGSASSLQAELVLLEAKRVKAAAARRAEVEQRAQRKAQEVRASLSREHT